MWELFQHRKVFQDVADALNVNANVRVGDADVTDANPVPVEAVPPGAFYHGQKVVAAAGTAEAVAAAQALRKGVLVKALSTNTGLVYVGGASVDSTNGFELAAGDMTYIEVDDLAEVYVDAAVNGEGVSYVAS